MIIDTYYRLLRLKILLGTKTMKTIWNNLKTLSRIWKIRVNPLHVPSESHIDIFDYKTDKLKINVCP